MTRAEILILACAAAFVAFFYGEYRGERAHAERIVANEDVCREGTPERWVSYPVTHLGELRGCIRVPPEPVVKSPRYMPRPRPVFVRKPEAM